ncbi:hypothetical protein EBR96_08955, partial [bacterium]|nr:hypothetical protein [bacterium]
MEGTNKPVKPVFRLTEPVFGPNTYLWIAVDYYITVMRLLFSESELKGRFDKFHLNNDRGAEIIRLGNSVFSLVENNLQGNRAVGPQDINETLKTVYFRSESDCDAFWRVLKSAYMAVSDPAGLIDTYSKWLPDTHDTVLKKVDAAFVISREDIRAPSLVSGLMAGLRTADICKFKSSALMAQFYVRLRMALQDGNGGHIDDAVREFGRWMTVSHASGIPFTPGNDPYLMPCGDLVASSEILFRPACAPFSAPKVQCACCNKEFKRSALISFSDHNDVMSRWVSHVVTPDGVGADAGYRFVGVPILFLPDNVLREKMAVPTFLFQIVSALRTVPEQDPLTWVSVRKSAVLQLVSGQFETQWMIKPQRVVRFLEGLESDDFKFLWHHILSDDGRLSCFRFAVVLNSERLLSRCHAELPLTPEVYDTVTDSRAGRNTLHHYLFSGFSSSDTQLLQWLRLFFFLVDLGFKPNSANRENELPLDRTLPIFRITLLHRLTESRLPGSGRIEPIQSELLPKPVQKLHAIRQNRMFDV